MHLSSLRYTHYIKNICQYIAMDTMQSSFPWEESTFKRLVRVQRRILSFYSIYSFMFDFLGTFVLLKKNKVKPSTPREKNTGDAF